MASLGVENIFPWMAVQRLLQSLLVESVPERFNQQPQLMNQCDAANAKTILIPASSSHMTNVFNCTLLSITSYVRNSSWFLRVKLNYQPHLLSKSCTEFNKQDDQAEISGS